MSRSDPWFRYSRKAGLTALPANRNGWLATLGFVFLLDAPLILLVALISEPATKVLVAIIYLATVVPFAIWRFLKFIVSKGVEA